MSIEQLWLALKAKPPVGWEFKDNRLGKYAEGPENENTSYGSFRNAVRKEKLMLSPPRPIHRLASM